MSIPASTILRVVAQLLWDDGEINQNVYNLQLAAGGGPFDELDVVDDCLDYVEDMYANMVAQMAAEMSGNLVAVYKYDAPNGDWDEVGSNAWVFSPTGAATTGLPRGVALLVTAKSEDPDKDARKYMPGLVEGALISETWGAGILTAGLNFAADWILPFVGAASGATFNPIVWSVVSSAAIDLIDSYIVSGIPAYQRRRKNNVGI